MMMSNMTVLNVNLNQHGKIKSRVTFVMFMKSRNIRVVNVNIKVRKKILLRNRLKLSMMVRGIPLTDREVIETFVMKH